MTTPNKFEQAARAMKALAKLDARESAAIAGARKKFSEGREAILLGLANDVAALVRAEREATNGE